MERRVRRDKRKSNGTGQDTSPQQPAPDRSFFARRPAVVTALLASVLVGAFALASLHHGASTASTVATRPHSALSGASGAAPATSPVPLRSPRPLTSAAQAQAQLRSVVLRLSQCLSKLSPQRSWTLVLRAGIGPRPYSSRAIARLFHISAAHETRIERTALLQLQSAARGATCGSPPVLVRVPPGDRLVPVATVLTQPAQPAPSTPQPAPSTGAPRRVTVSGARLSTIRRRTARVSFTLRSAEHNAAIRTITVELPSAIKFSRSLKHLRAGVVVVNGGGRRLTVTARIRHGMLALRLKAPRSGLHVTLTSPALTVSRAFAQTIGTRALRTLPTRIVTTDTQHRTTRLIVNTPAR